SAAAGCPTAVGLCAPNERGRARLPWEVPGNRWARLSPRSGSSSRRTTHLVFTPMEFPRGARAVPARPREPAPSVLSEVDHVALPRNQFSLRNGAGVVDAPGSGVVEPKGNSPL